MNGPYPDPSLIAEPPGTSSIPATATPPAFSVAPVNPNSRALLEALGGGNTTADDRLLSILQRVEQTLQRPVVPDNWMAQMGTALQGFSSGVAGRANPALESFRQQRDDEVRGLLGQAQITGNIAEIGDKRLRRIAEERRLQQADTREERLLRNAENEEARRAKEFAFNVYKTQKDDPNRDTRLGALKLAQKSGLIAADADLEDLANFPGSHWEKAHDRGLSLIEAGYDPTDPQFATVIPKGLHETFRGYMQMKNDPVLLNEQRFKPKEQGDVLKSIYLGLAPGAKKGTLNADQQMLFDSIGDVLKLKGDRVAEIERYAGLIEQEARAKGEPPKPRFAYIQQAKALTSLDGETRDWLTSKGIYSPTPEQVGKAREAVRSEKIVDSQAKSLRTRAVTEYNARLGGKRSDAMFSNYSDEDLRKLTQTEDSVLAELLRGAIGGGAPGAGRPAAGGAMKNGKSYDQNIAELMKHGRTRDQAVKEVDGLKAQGKL